MTVTTRWLTRFLGGWAYIKGVHLAQVNLLTRMWVFMQAYEVHND